MRSAILSVLVLLACSCATSSESQLDALRAQQQVESARLDAIRREISASEFEAARAKVRAQFEECRAGAASISAQATITIAECQEQRAQHAECAAKNEAGSAKSAVGGCVLGLLFAAVTGGAGTPWALGGCAAGAAVGGASGSQCAAVQCSTDPGAALTNSIAAHGLARFPVCGGMIGVTLAPQPAQILAVVPGSPAAQIGLAPGDVIVKLDNDAVATGPALALLVEGHPQFDTVRVGFLRQGRYLEVPVMLGRRTP